MSRSTSMYLSRAQWFHAMKRLRQLIVKGRPLTGFDDTTIGCKDTQCHWGMCGRTKEVWEDDCRMWPDRPVEHAVKYSPPGALCPLDRRESGGPQGCFFSCRYFSPKKGDEKLTKEFVIKLFDSRLGSYAYGPD